MKEAEEDKVRKAPGTHHERIVDSLECIRRVEYKLERLLERMKGESDSKKENEALESTMGDFYSVLSKTPEFIYDHTHRLTSLIEDVEALLFDANLDR